MKTLEEIAARSTCLGALHFRSLFEVTRWQHSWITRAFRKPDPEALEMVRGMTGWLHEAGLIPSLTQAERALVAAPPMTWTRQLIHQILKERYLEASGTLLWVLGVVPELPAYDTPFHQDTVRRLPFLSDSPFVKHPGMKPAAEFASMVSSVKQVSRQLVAAEEQRAEMWLWRARTTQLVVLGDLSLSSALDILKDGAPKCRELGIAQTADSDFLAFGKAYSALGPTQWAAAYWIATARLSALRWVLSECAWDEVPLDT